MAPTNLVLPASLLLLSIVNARTILDATLLSAAPAPTGTGTAVFTWSVDCPSDENDANDDCRDLSIFPAEVWHTQNGAWGGKMTGKKGVATTWSCDLNSKATGRARCVDTISTKGAKAVTTTTALGCHGDRQLVPLRISEGEEKLPEGWEGVLMGELNQAYGGGLEDKACANTWTMQSSAPTVTGTRVGGNATTAATGTTATTGTGAVEVTGTSLEDAVPSQTGEGAGGRIGVSGGLLVVGAAAAIWFGA
ncbi:hypothetical protein ACLOAV_003324 [Pseudogymnoascus australis]